MPKLVKFAFDGPAPVEKLVVNKMMVQGADKRLYSIALNCGGVINGLTPDGRSII